MEDERVMVDRVDRIDIDCNRLAKASLAVFALV